MSVTIDRARSLAEDLDAHASTITDLIAELADSSDEPDEQLDQVLAALRDAGDSAPAMTLARRLDADITSSPSASCVEDTGVWSQRVAAGAALLGEACARVTDAAEEHADAADPEDRAVARLELAAALTELAGAQTVLSVLAVAPDAGELAPVAPAADGWEPPNRPAGEADWMPADASPWDPPVLQALVEQLAAQDRSGMVVVRLDGTVIDDAPLDMHAFAVAEVLCDLPARDALPHGRAGDDGRALRWCWADRLWRTAVAQHSDDFRSLVRASGVRPYAHPAHES